MALDSEVHWGSASLWDHLLAQDRRGKAWIFLDEMMKGFWIINDGHEIITFLYQWCQGQHVALSISTGHCPWPHVEWQGISYLNFHLPIFLDILCCLRHNSNVCSCAWPRRCWGLSHWWRSALGHHLQHRRVDGTLRAYRLQRHTHYRCYNRSQQHQLLRKKVQGLVALRTI